MFYDNYIQLCNNINKSPSAVAEEIGFKKSAVTSWKNGRTPTDANARKIAEYFGITFSELMGKKRAVPDSDTEEDAQLLRRIHALSPAARGKLLGYLDALAEQ